MIVGDDGFEEVGRCTYLCHGGQECVLCVLGLIEWRLAGVCVDCCAQGRERCAQSRNGRRHFFERC